jgi:hypothetical protein
MAGWIDLNMRRATPPTHFATKAKANWPPRCNINKE